MHRRLLALLVATAPLGACLSAFEAPAGGALGGEPVAGDDAAPVGEGIDPATGRHHPVGFADAATHGVALRLQTEDCRACHGQELTGLGTSPSCDGCHQADWRTDCTYCHGDVADGSGAPPRDLDGTSDPAAISFGAHRAHGAPTMAAPFDCTQCHAKPTDVLTVDHAFDATPGASEVTLAGGLSPAGVYDGAGGCSSLYCHGNGRGDNGTSSDGMPTPGCAGCHPGQDSGATAWGTMSGDHRKHMGVTDVGCADCHLDVTSDGTSLAQVALHLDRAKQVRIDVAGFTFAQATLTCDGTCHGKGHTNLRW